MNAHVLEVRNVNHALREALWWLKVSGVEEPSRNGPVLVAPGPVLTEYARPLERVLFDPTRDANPFFHFFEALWMLGGRNDIRYVAAFAKNMLNYSDDGEVLHGAYGFRWREWFAFDQLDVLVRHLVEQPESRRAVLTMWSPNGDLVASEGAGGIHMKDVPCNTHCYFDLRGGALNMSVLCRSNDAVWGAYGANAVHFAFLMEYVAARLGAVVGKLYQYSHNLHLYTEKFDERWREAVTTQDLDPYQQRSSDVAPAPLLSGPYEDMSKWEADLMGLLRMREPLQLSATKFYTNFFTYVAKPLLQAHYAYRRRDFSAAYTYVDLCVAGDWQRACQEWLLRREAA